jgi:hypothetical protein
MDAPHVVAARAIVAALRAQGGIEAFEDEPVVAELAAELGAHTAELVALAEAVPPDAPGRWEALLAAAEAAGIEVDDEAVAPLIEELAGLLDDSENVDELYVDDAALHRILQAALLDFVAAEKDLLFEKLRRASSPRVVSVPKPPPTLADLGMPFPLFEAPRSEAVLDDAGPCTVCGVDAALRFRKACYACFRAGKVKHTIDTELGVVSSDTAASGWTGGLPKGARTPASFAQRLRVDGGREAWVEFQVDPAALVELTRTPAYSTAQGESWLYCCKLPMVYRGQLDSTDLVDRPADDPAVPFLAKLLGLSMAEAEEAAEEIMAGRFSVYAFRCRHCGNERAHGDRA